jgi:hypothetical protein
MLKLILILLALSFYQSHDSLKFLSNTNSCWVNAYSRGEGKPLKQCEADEFKVAIRQPKGDTLCEKYCPQGWTRQLFKLCMKSCPPGYPNSPNDLVCTKTNSYGRGIGYFPMNWETCEQDNPQGCELNGLLIYPRCAAGYHNVGCCVCSRDCPDGYRDLGPACLKPSFKLTYRKFFQCDQEIVEQKCLPSCKEGFRSHRTLCLAECPEGMTLCGVICLRNQNCTKEIWEQTNLAVCHAIKEHHDHYEINFEHFGYGYHQCIETNIFN